MSIHNGPLNRERRGARGERAYPKSAPVTTRKATAKDLERFARRQAPDRFQDGPR